jgi:hypothetical protein
MTFQDGRRDPLDVVPVPDVADLVLALQLGGERAQALFASREQDYVPAV